MGSVAIKVENISKKYTIGKKTSGSLRETLTNTLSGLLNNKGHSRTSEEFWALKDVSFEIEKGDAVGIIGKNGAGKSTLLKILSKITKPTKGRIVIDGRIASLLEIGTGFHPELTGRENIFMNGVMLGMNKSEIKKKFNEIVDFSGIEKFIDTPVKRYSSGMYVRLGFAVAAHLEPEILIVDEVLAVGDAEFQKKCLGKMKDVAGHGRTVLFVSHNMAAIENLCTKCILIQDGTNKFEGNTEAAIDFYLGQKNNMGKISLNQRVDRTGTQAIKFTSFQALNIDGSPLNCILSGQAIKFRLGVMNSHSTSIGKLRVDLGLNKNDTRIVWFSTEMMRKMHTQSGNTDMNFVDLTIDKLPLTPGSYSFSIHCTLNGEVSDYINDAFYFDVEAGDFYNTGKLIPFGQGNFLVDYKFEYIS